MSSDPELGSRMLQDATQRPFQWSMWRWCSAVLLIAGCARVGTSFTPMKAEYAEGVHPMVTRAKIAYQGDLPELLAAGGQIIGEINASGNGFADQTDVRDEVAVAAARRGATHVVFVSAYAEKDRTPDQYSTQCTNGVCTTVQTGGYAFYRPHATYVLVRVPVEAPDLSWRANSRTAAPRSPSATPNSNSWATQLQTARRTKQRALEQARRHCYESAPEQYGQPILPEEDALLATEAARPVTADDLRRVSGRSTAAAENATPVVATSDAQPGVLAWYRVCVQVEAESLLNEATAGDSASTSQPQPGGNGDQPAEAGAGPLTLNEAYKEARRKCFEQADVRYRATREPAANTGDAAAESVPQDWATAYAASRRSPGAVRSQDPAKEDAVNWYNACVAREAQTLARSGS